MASQTDHITARKSKNHSFRWTKPLAKDSHYSRIMDAKNRNIENILILYGDHLYQMNYMDFVKVCHYSSNDINF
ncbi:hypothetical protein IMY05_016G0063900 [Salix suchowensis]|nr:hypothetical protein IMY05_016G0063900 [Salix suchowensis]